mmetsp:Transcript_5989/g.8223  ORF Transcript_5989/g.8223 Transcript_5989/m.8223 type:complete len:159 (+) Transcript_5989:675-1151(+)
MTIWMIIGRTKTTLQKKRPSKMGQKLRLKRKSQQRERRKLLKERKRLLKEKKRLLKEKRRLLEKRKKPLKQKKHEAVLVELDKRNLHCPVSQFSSSSNLNIGHIFGRWKGLILSLPTRIYSYAMLQEKINCTTGMAGYLYDSGSLQCIHELKNYAHKN